MASSISSVPFPIALKNDGRDERNDKESESPEFLNNMNSNNYDQNSKIMVMAIISLSVVVLLVLALHVYARHALRRHARRRREAAFHRLTLSATVSQAQAQAQAQTAKPAGLDASEIAYLPAVSAPGGSSDCAVCLGALAQGEAARLLPGCGHAFHVECIDAWLASQASCPVCRAVVVPPPPRPEPREGPSAPLLGSLSINALEVGTTSSEEHGYFGGGKALSSSSRFSSFRRMITRERSSSRRVQSSSDQDQELVGNLERGSD